MRFPPRAICIHGKRGGIYAPLLNSPGGRRGGIIFSPRATFPPTPHRFYLLSWGEVIVSVNSRCYLNLSLNMYLEISPGFVSLRICAFLCRALFVSLGVEAVLARPIFDRFVGMDACVIFFARYLFSISTSLSPIRHMGREVVVVFPGGAMTRQDKTGKDRERKDQTEKATTGKARTRQDTTGQNRTRQD